MDQSMNMDHNYGVPFIPRHLYQRNNSKVAHHVLLGCLRSLIRSKPQRLEEQMAANIFPCPLMQVYSTVVVHG
ncbi:hypothetical protein ROHU_021342 [Labeo rohita]|uniref:Uncharacterized protein n=1 Tax=Labeo rohita TaxID=84645 RepID=A0A498N581_LABRO|nr:hypothetical protein ROHU_021342 [Labeo rohita]